MLKREDIPYPEDYFPNVDYTHNHGRKFGRKSEPLEVIPEWQLLYRAFEYIGRFRKIDENGKEKKLAGDVQNYNFSIFQSNDSRGPTTRIGGYIQFLSGNINKLLDISPETPVSKVIERQKRKTMKIEEIVGILGTEIYPDTDFMLTLNYGDFPVGFLGFSIEDESTIIVKQIQSSGFTDKVRLYFSERHHLLDGFDWEKVLITFIEDYLKEKGFSGKIVIQCARKNRYFTWDGDFSNDVRKKEKQEQINGSLRRHYDESALALGYYRDKNSIGSILPDHYNFIKEL